MAYKKRKQKRKNSLYKLLKLGFLSVILLAVTGIVVYSIVFGIKTNAESITQNTVLLQLEEHLVLPENEPVSLRRVSNAKELATQDSFYKDIKNGDYIIIFENLSLIYDFDKSLIKNIKTK